jgi:hypothetical protein
MGDTTALKIIQYSLVAVEYQRWLLNANGKFNAIFADAQMDPLPKLQRIAPAGPNC